MSIQAVAWVLEESESTYANRLVLLAIANHADRTGWAWPSAATLAREARVDRATVFRAIDALVQLGELHVVKSPGKPNWYILTALDDQSQIATGQVEVEGSQIATGGSQIATGGVASAQHEPSRTIKNRRAGAGTREATDTTPIITEYKPDMPIFQTKLTHEQREAGLKHVKDILRRSE